jgi:hypothetical protein
VSEGRQLELLAEMKANGGACLIRIVAQGRYCHTAELRQLGRRIDGCRHGHPSRERAVECGRAKWPGVQLEEATP